MKITTIGFDGDDTLWHHENYFQKAREQFHSVMNEIGDYPDAVSLAEAKHINNLPLWGYGVKSFTLSMIEAAIEMSHDQINGHTIKQIIDIGHSLYDHPVILLDHIAETLQALQGKYRLVLITKGDLVAQEIKISQSKLAPFFESTEIVSEKNTDIYARLFKRLNINPAEFLMVGNSVKSDVLPPVQLGGYAAHIPYYITFSHERADVTENFKDKISVLETVKDLPALIARLEQSA